MFVRQWHPKWKCFAIALIDKLEQKNERRENKEPFQFAAQELIIPRLKAKSFMRICEIDPRVLFKHGNYETIPTFSLKTRWCDYVRWR